MLAASIALKVLGGLRSKWEESSTPEPPPIPPYLLAAAAAATRLLFYDPGTSINVCFATASQRLAL